MKLLQHMNCFLRGEIYYLHLLQGIEQFPETREKLQALIRNLLTSKSNKFSKLANWIQNLWEKEQGFENGELVIEKHLGYIPINGYINCALFSINELITFLSNEMQPIIKLEL